MSNIEPQGSVAPLQQLSNGEEYWIESSDRLYQALMSNPTALVALVVEHAPPAEIARLAGRQFDTDSKAFDSVLATLRTRIPVGWLSVAS